MAQDMTSQPERISLRVISSVVFENSLLGLLTLGGQSL